MAEGPGTRRSDDHDGVLQPLPRAAGPEQRPAAARRGPEDDRRRQALNGRGIADAGCGGLRRHDSGAVPAGGKRARLCPSTPRPGAPAPVGGPAMRKRLGPAWADPRRALDDLPAGRLPSPRARRSGRTPQLSRRVGSPPPAAQPINPEADAAHQEDENRQQPHHGQTGRDDDDQDGQNHRDPRVDKQRVSPHRGSLRKTLRGTCRRSAKTKRSRPGTQTV
jgi:hypothetical protein